MTRKTDKVAKCTDSRGHDWTRYKVDEAYVHDIPQPVPVKPCIPVSICTRCHMIDTWLYVPGGEGDDDIHLVGMGEIV